MSDSGAIGKLLFMTGGLLVWAVHFTIIYGFTTVACANGFGASRILGIGLVPFVIGSATLLALATTALVLRTALAGPVPPRFPQYSDATERFLQYTAVTIASLSLIAIAWNVLPVFVVAPC